MKDTSVNAFQQYAAFNLGSVGSDLLYQFREIANCSPLISTYYNDEFGSLNGVKDHLSLAKHAIKGLLHSTPEESSLAESLQAALMKCNQLQTELLEFLLTDQNTGEPWTKGSLVDEDKLTGLQRKRVEVIHCIDAIDEISAEICETKWRVLQKKILKMIDSCLLGFPETLSEIEAQLPPELKPFTTLARVLSELREQRKKKRLNTNDKIPGTYFHVLNVIEPQLRPLFDTCIQLQPVLRSAIPVRIDDENLETSLFEIRTSIAQKLKEQDSLETSLSSFQHPVSLVSNNTVQAAAQSATHMPENATLECETQKTEQDEDSQQGSGVALLNDFKWEPCMDGIRINGIEVKLTSKLEVGMLECLCRAKHRLNKSDLSQARGANEPSEPSGVSTKLTKIRNQIRLAFELEKKVNPIPSQNLNQVGLWKLDKQLLLDRAKELQELNSISPPEK